VAKPLPVSVPVSNDIETLRKHIVVNLNNLSLRIAQQDNRTSPMSMGNNRLTDVPDPANALDAVNFRTLKKYLQGIIRPHTKSATNAYVICWSVNGTATGTAPAYIINPDRTGSPSTVKIYTLNPGSSPTGANIYYRQGGTGTPAKILTNDIILGSGVNGPVSSSSFNLTAALSVNDVLYTVITTGGGASNLTMELLVQP
jgi:hypothetical protein